VEVVTVTHTIGIDFGTAFVTVADWEKAPRILLRMPAIARMLHGGGALCGEPAYAARNAYALSTVDQVKRFLGRSRAEIKDALRQVAWTIEPAFGAADDFLIDAWTGSYESEEIAAEILRAAKTQAEVALRQPVTGAVLTIAAAATNRQRLALKNAARRAGLTVRRILNEPSAIAIAEAHFRPVARDERWAVVNFGAGMTDVAIVDVSQCGVAVRAAAGDTQLGLASLRAKLIRQLETQFKRKTGAEFSTRPEIRAELLWIAEESLQALNLFAEHRVDLRAAGSINGATLDLDITLARHDLESAARPALRKLRELCVEAMRRARTNTSEIRRVVFTGGGALMPLLRQTIAETFRQPCANLGDSALSLSATGAALLGAALDGRATLELQDVLAQGLGVTLVNDGFSTLLPAGAVFPVKKSSFYTTVADFQERIRFEVREGNQPCASRNEILGAFLLSGVRRARAGEPNVKVTFEIDESGILNVQAQDADTQARQTVMLDRATPARIATRT
jgi:molecular chaperone DnaK